MGTIFEDDDSAGEYAYGDAEAIIRALEARQAPSLLDVEGGAGRLVIAVPKGVELRSVKPLLDEYRKAPERRKGHAKAFTLASFIEHAKRFADTDSAIFASPGGGRPMMVVVFDYHRQTAEGAPRFGEHRVIYEPPLSEEWQAWVGKNNRGMSQADFAAFIEDRITDLKSQDDAGQSARDLMLALDCTFAAPVKLIELSRGLSVRQNVSVTNAVNLQSGEAQINYQSEHNDAKSHQPLRVPGAFLIGIPVFRGGELFQIAARLRYRIDGTKITWFYSLYRHERVFEVAFEEACAAAKKETGLPLFVGTPEQVDD